MRSIGKYILIVALLILLIGVRQTRNFLIYVVDTLINFVDDLLKNLNIKTVGDVVDKIKTFYNDLLHAVSK